MDTPLTGTLHLLYLYDVSEEIPLERLREILGVQPPRREPSFKHPAPDYVRFERPPVVQLIDPILTASGERLEGRIKYYDYGVVCVALDAEFRGSWDDLVRFSARWIAAPELERLALETARRQVARARPVLIKPNESWLSEDYYIVQLHSTGRPPESAQASIAQIVRGELIPLSDSERLEVLQSSMSYYPSDLLVVGWTAAFVYDTPEGAAPAIELLEYANTQLLEFRHYDEVLTRVLERVYKNLERRGGFFDRWRLASEAERLNTLRLDVTELAERTDNSIKFLSDMFYARAYRLAAGKVGVGDYRRLVDAKLRTAGELYESLVNEFHQGRAFFLELTVVAILLIELFMLFRGKG